MDGVDIGLFDYDRYNTLYFFIMNADEQIYMRYGGRDASSQDSYLDLNSIELALGKGLELHKKYLAGEIQKTERPKPLFPKDFPLLIERTSGRGACVECHLIGDFQLQHREEDGTLDRPMQMYRSPDIKTLGIHLDVPNGLVVKEVTGPVAEAGMLPGDTVAALEGTPVWTFADLQYRLDRLPRDSKSAKMIVDRGGKTVELTVSLPKLWWFTDIRYRQLTVDPRTYFESRPLTEAEKKAHDVPADGFASAVKYVDAMGEMLKSHALKVGDIIYAVDGITRDEYANTAEFYIKLHKKAGDDVVLDVIRDGKRLRMPLKTFRMSFRK
jgi:hypothetical protein